MQKSHIRHSGFAPFVFVLVMSVANAQDQAAVAAAQTDAAVPQTADAAQLSDVIARVGDETITFSMLNTMLNSSAMVGLSLPSLGTPERNKVIITLLDKAISANLLYLDAFKQGTDRGEDYREKMRQFEDAVLATMYKTNVLIGGIPVSADEVEAYYKANISSDQALDDDLKLAIESRIRKDKYTGLEQSLRERLRTGTTVTIDDKLLGSRHDDQRAPDDVVAKIGDRPVTWRDVEAVMRGADERASLAEFYIDQDKERERRLQQYIDNTLMVDKARAAGMDKSAEFVQRTAEYRKTELINIHRHQLIRDWQPSDGDLAQYYLDHMERIMVPESRKIQTVVLASKEEAEAVKADIESGKITIYKAAQDYSLDPTAKTNLGELGWVSHGTGFPELDKFTFELGPGVVGGPVETPAGWQLVKVLDVADARYTNIDQPETRKRTLKMMIDEKLNAYVVNLRKNDFKVEVYNEVLAGHFRQEADYIAALNRKAVEEGSLTKQRQQDLQKWIAAPPVKQE